MKTNGHFSETIKRESAEILDILFEMIHFKGWTFGGAWEDLKLGCKHFNHIERIAIVGNRQWESAMVNLCHPFTRARIRHLDIDDLPESNFWLHK